jgi:hypothetical protein
MAVKKRMRSIAGTPMSRMGDPVPRIGQMWRDNSPRLSRSRIGYIVQIDYQEGYATINWQPYVKSNKGYGVPSAETRVLLTRLNGKANGYGLVEDVDIDIKMKPARRGKMDGYEASARDRNGKKMLGWAVSKWGALYAILGLARLDK